MSERFFDDHQRATVEAAMARIIPTDHQPGAREAGCIDFLDRYLSGIDFIYAKPDGSGFERLEGLRAEAWKTRIDLLRATYVRGVAELDRRADAHQGMPFVEIDAAAQDAVLTTFEGDRPSEDPGSAGTVPAYGLKPAADEKGGPALQQTNTETELDFFPLLVAHTRQGFYADPIYGGNRDRVGWGVIGFPGPTSLAEVFSGRYSVLAWFADGHQGTTPETNDGR